MSSESAAGAAAPYLLERIEAAMAIVSEAMLCARARGLDRAGLYLAGAAGNLRIAAMNAQSAPQETLGGRRQEAGVLVLGETGFGLRPTGERMVAERVRLRIEANELVIRPAAGEDLPPSPATHNLAIELANSVAVRALAQGPVFAALLENGLGHHDWWCRRTETLWHSSIAAAATVVDVVSGGRWRPRFGPDETAGLIDAVVTSELSKLGWTPMGEILLSK